MEFLLDRLPNEILLKIISLLDPSDLSNLSTMSPRLTQLAEYVLNKISNLDITGTDRFPNLQLPHIIHERIRVNKNWFDGKFRRKEWIYYMNVDATDIVLDLHHVYVPNDGRIRRYERKGKYLNSKFKLLGRKGDQITAFTKKENLILAGCSKGDFMIFEDDKLTIDDNIYQIDPENTNPRGDIFNVDLFPRNDVYVTGDNYVVTIFNKTPNDGSIFAVDKIPQRTVSFQIDLSGERLIMGHDETGTLYNFNTKTRENITDLGGAWDVVWKDNHTILSGHDDGSLKLFDLRTKSVSQRIDVKDDKNISIQFDGQNAVICGFEFSRTISICDLRKNAVLKDFNVYDEGEGYNLWKIAADSKHLFAITTSTLEVLDFTI